MSNINKKIPRLRFVLPPDTTPALRSLLQVNGRGSPVPGNPSSSSLNSLPVGSIIEACPEGLVLVQDIADRIEKCHGGAALIIDYGGDGSSGGDTLRGFWKHTQVHPLSKPGEVDVTADVDFGALREAVNRRVSLSESLERKRRQEERGRTGNVKSANSNGSEETTASVDDFYGSNEGKHLRPEAFGPISQGRFLAQMGIVQRVEKKIEDPETTDDEAYELYSAMERLLLSEQMGERYKVLAIAPKKDDLFPPPGF
jgi:NADH dehydrogenase [ubiquinone] 1 alpha subcomplex assembly factor 7